MQESLITTTLSDVELQLIRSRESLDFALKSGRMGTWEINLDARTIICSPEMLDLWGVSSDQFKGDRAILQSKVHPADLKKMNDAIDNAIKNHSVYELEYRIRPSPGEEKWVLSRGRCTFSPARFSGVVYDITESKMKEEALAAAIKTRDQFFMIASHELRTPLTCLQLQIQVMEWELKQFEGTELTGKLESGLKKQQDHLMRISRLVDNILDESMIMEGRLQIEYEHFDISEMVAGVVDRFKVAAESSGVELTFTNDKKVSGKWDRFRLEQVLLNLLMNAIRYGNKKPIHVEVDVNKQHALISVRDNGMGIKPEDQKRVFERFERVISDNEVSGIGLGLYISNNIVRAHGGEILIKSEINKGSEFTVVLPLSL